MFVIMIRSSLSRKSKICISGLMWVRSLKNHRLSCRYRFPAPGVPRCPGRVILPSRILTRPCRVADDNARPSHAHTPFPYPSCPTLPKSSVLCGCLVGCRETLDHGERYTDKPVISRPTLNAPVCRRCRQNDRSRSFGYA